MNIIFLILCNIIPYETMLKSRWNPMAAENAKQKTNSQLQNSSKKKEI